MSTTTVNSSELSWLPQGGNRHWKARNNNQPRQVHATLDDSTEDPEKDPVEEADLDPADLEGELEVLLTQVAKKRAQIEKARGFTKNETPTEREQRIKDMKARMPCSACKAHGKTVYGHWRGDAACPYKKDKEKNVLASGPARTMSTWRPHLMMMPRNKPSRGGGLGEVWVGAISEGKLRSASRFTLALSDTCCARSVAWEKWVQHHLRHLHAFREDTFIVEEARPFRFGAGPRVMSTYAVIIPVNIPGAKNWAHLRVSVVDQDVPLLISKSALKALGVVLDLARGCVCFGELCTDVPLRETIDINLESSRQQYECPHEDLLSDDCEVVLSEIDKSSQDQVWMIDENHAGNHQCRRATHQAVQGCESYARELRLSQDFSYAALLNLLRRLPQGRRNRHRQINGAPGPITGVFAHGNHVGVTKRTRKYPQVVKYINKFMRQRSDQPWSSFSLQRDVCTHVHKDVHNDKDAKSVTVTFGDFQGGQLWIADDDVDQSGKVRDTVWKQDDRGNSLPGRLVDTREKPLVFSPHTPHATCEWQGERWCLSMYCARDIDQVDSDAWTALKRLSFPIKRWVRSRTFGKAEHSSHDAMLSSCHREPPERRGDRHHDDETPQLTDDLSRHRVQGQVASSIGGHDDSDRGAQEERRVCASHCMLVPSSGSRTSSPHGGQTQGTVRCSEAETPIVSAPGELQEARLRESEGVVRDKGCEGPRPTSRLPLVEVDQVAADTRDRAMAFRRAELPRAHGGGRVTLPQVLGMRDTDDNSHEPSDETGIPRLSPLPELQSDSAIGIRRATSPRGDRGARGEGQDREQGPRDADSLRGEDREEGQGRASQSTSQSSGRISKESSGPAQSSDASWVKSQDGTGASGGSLLGRRGRPLPEVQSQSHEGGDRDDRRDAAQQGQSGSGQRRRPQVSDDAGAVSSGEAAESAAPRDRPPLDRGKVVELIRQGKAKRAQLKKGTVKRLLGNTRALIVAVFISTVTGAGAATQAIPYAYRNRPDVLEVFDGRAQVSSTFSRDEEGRTDILKWIRDSQPRLVVISNCCPFQPPVYAVHRNESQARRRERRWRERQKQIVSFIQDVFDSQLKHGDHFLAELPFGEHWGVQSLADNMMRHPSIQCVYGWDLSRDSHSHQKNVWAVTSKHIVEQLENGSSPRHSGTDRKDRSIGLETRSGSFAGRYAQDSSTA